VAQKRAKMNSVILHKVVAEKNTKTKRNTVQQTTKQTGIDAAAIYFLFLFWDEH